MFYGCDMEYEVDDADPDAAKKLKERVSIPTKSYLASSIWEKDTKVINSAFQPRSD